MEQYLITGMSCAACSARVEKAVSKVPGVKSCSVSLLTNSMGVDGDADSNEIIKAVEKAGYGAKIKNGMKGKGAVAGAFAENADDSVDTATGEIRVLERRLAFSVFFLLALMYFSMGHTMLGLPVFWEGNAVAIGLIQLLFSAVVMVINQKFFQNGFKSLFSGAPNMDTLVALGSGVSFLYSTGVLFVMTEAQKNQEGALAMQYLHGLYFESAAMILTLITVGKLLEAKAKGRTTDALKGLIKLAPKTAVILKDGQEMQISAAQVKIGDIFLVRPGESIPVDGVVIEGFSAVNEAALTGESIPVDKKAGDSVSAATINQSGFLKCEAKRVGEDTILSGIIRMVSDAAATKAPIAKIADRVSGVFVPTVIVIAVVTFAVWLILGESLAFSLARGISVLVISCPCALGLATPVAIMVGNGVGARNGILFKTAVSLEETGKVAVAALDKTGTITGGTMQVTDLSPADGISEEELLCYAGSLERKSEHPLAEAVTAFVGQKTHPLFEVTDFEALPGRGLKGKNGGEWIYGGNEKFIRTVAPIPEKEKGKALELSEQGKTVLYFAGEDQFLGIIAVADVIRKDSVQAVRELKDMGIHVIMLTGDQERTANAIGAQAEVDEVIAGVLPDEKGEAIRRLKEQGKVIMVGDGINDAPALAVADIGIAIGAGTDIAIDAADIVLMKSRLSDVVSAIRLSRATLKNIRENLFWAFFYNCVGIPLAAGVFIPLTGWELNPMFGAAAMSLSSFCVVTNALRLNRIKLRESASRSEILTEKSNAEKMQDRKENDKMTKTMKIEGMMCGHCEATVKKALESLDGVAEAVVSHENGSAVVTLTGDVSDDTLKKAVEDKDYKVTGIQ